MWPVTVDDDEVRFFPTSSEPISSSSPSVRAPARWAIPKHVTRRKHARMLAPRLHYGREPHLVEHVEPSVATRPRSAPSETGTAHARPHLGYRRNAGSRFRFDPGQCSLSVVIREQLLLALVDPDTVGRAQCARRAQAGEIFQVRHPPEICLTWRFRRGTRTRAWCTSALCCSDSLATASSSSREQATANRGANAALQPSFWAHPLPSDREAFSSSEALSPPESPGHLASRITHALSDRRAHAAFADRLEYHLRIVHGFHGEHGGCPLAGARSSRGASRAQRRRRVRGFHRPHAHAEPVHQRQVIGIAAEQRLAEMDVRLDEPGRTYPPRASITRSCRSAMFEDTAGDRPPLIDTSPSTTSSWSSW